MVTLRTYFSEPEALVAKTLLDDHGIFCSVADSNAHLYGGAPFSMPVRLLVAEEDVDKATHVLEDPTREYDVDRGGLSGEQRETSQESAAKNNPWEILAIASLFFLPGVALLLQTKQLILLSPSWASRWNASYRFRRGYITVFSPHAAHLLGFLAISIAVLLAILFFKTRLAITRERAQP